MSEKGLQQIRNLTLATRIPKEKRNRGGRGMRGIRGDIFRNPGFNRMSSIDSSKCDEDMEDGDASMSMEKWNMCFMSFEIDIYIYSIWV